MSIGTAAIREQIVLALGTELGAFKLPDNSTIKSIKTVKNIHQEPPSDWEMEGLVCLIHRSPKRVIFGTFDGNIDRYQWQVELIMYDPERHLQNAIDLMLCNFKDIKLLNHQRANEDNFEQALMGISDQQYFKVDQP